MCSSYNKFIILIGIGTVFVSEPNIEDIVNIDKINVAKKKVVTYSNRQLIAREIEMEKMRKLQMALPAGTATTTDSEISKTRSATKDTSTLPNHLQTLKAKTVKMQTRVST